MFRLVIGLNDVKVSIIWTAAVLGWIAGGAGPASAEALGPWSGSQIAMAGAGQVWQTQLPLKYTEHIVGYHLVGANMYAIGNDGFVRAIRADNGLHIWTRPLAATFDTIWPPISGELEGRPVVLFTLLDEVVFLDPATGQELKRVKLPATTTASVAASTEYLFHVGPDSRVRCIRIEDAVKEWGFATPATINLPPIYLADGDEMLVVDTRGTTVSFDSNKTKYFIRDLEADPAGPVAADRLAFYLVTTDGVLHAIERRTGDLLWHYFMVEGPNSGPVVTPTALYQATATGGLYRFDTTGTAALATRPAVPLSSVNAAVIGAAVPDAVPSTQPGNSKKKVNQPVRDLPKIDADHEIRRWYNPLGRQFLAEWPERIVVLQTDGHLGLIPLNSRNGEPAEILDLGPVDGGVSNTLNDAVYLTSPKGLVRCLRPVGAAPLTLADFGVAPTSQPAASPQEETPSEEEQPAPSAAGQDTSLTDPLRSHKVLAQ